MSNWKVSAEAPKPVIQQALLAHEDALDWDHDVILSGREIEPDKPDDWVLEAWLARKPGTPDLQMISDLFEDVPPKLEIEQLPDEDWLVLSQQGVEPIDAGCFHIHTPEYPPSDTPGMRSFAIPASQAFGTGQHETTAGCLTMLTHMRKQGVVARHVADIGTGTGLLAFAALHLWPLARATASDIDAVCVDVVEHNASENAVPMGPGHGALTMVVADGMDDPLLEARGPYDLLIANILAGPLVDLAPDFAASVPPRGHLLLAGLLETQEAKLRAAYRKVGFRLAARLVKGDWSILWMRKRTGKLAGMTGNATPLP